MKRLACRSAVLLLVIAASALGAAQDQIILPSSRAFSLIAGVLATSPITTANQFREFEPQLRKFGFVKIDSIQWRYVNAGDVVNLNAYPEQGDFFVELLPGGNVRPIGDATLAALIAKASTALYDEGDSVELLMSERHSTSQGRSVSDTIHLHFKLSGGIWWKTSRVIAWSTH
jgi:hypothetical protein